MKIILAEDRGGKLLGERSFTSDVVLVGRDPAVCHFFFAQNQWPMVSRRHAEFRLTDGRWIVTDANSRFGTFVNGQKAAAPVEVRVGSHVQLGADGPILRVVSIEQSPVAVSKPSAKPIAVDHMPTVRDAPAEIHKSDASAPTEVQPPSPPPAPAQPARLELLDPIAANVRRFELNKDVFQLGRDPQGDVVIDAAAAVVSRRHAEIRRVDGQFAVVDLKSFNGTLVNGQRITGTVKLFDKDQVQLGTGGPILRLIDPAHPAAAESRLAGIRPGGVAAPQSIPSEFGQIAAMARRQTIVSTSGSISQQTPAAGQSQLLARVAFDARMQLSVGRAADNDVRLDGLQISNHHARFARSNGSVTVEDAGSTNGVYVNGQRVSSRRAVQQSDVIQIGPFVLQADAQHGVAVYDTRSKTRIDCINIVKIVANRSGGGSIKLLDDVSLTVQPNEFIGLLGPSGAGKSTLMDSLNGMRPATSGFVLVNNLDLYRHLDSLKQSIGYVPQDDIIHRELRSEERRVGN